MVRGVPSSIATQNFEDMSILEPTDGIMNVSLEKLRSYFPGTPNLSSLLPKPSALDRIRIGLQREQHLNLNENRIPGFQTWRTLEETKKGI